MDIAYGVGRLGGASLASPAQLVIDNQLIALLKEYVGGVQVDDDYLAIDEIVAAGIGGSFVQSKHTLRHCRDYVEPGLFRFQLQQTWEAEGEKDLYERAVDEYRRLKTRGEARRPAGRRAARHGRRGRSRRQGPVPVTTTCPRPWTRASAGTHQRGHPRAETLGGTVSINDIRQAVLDGRRGRRRHACARAELEAGTTATEIMDAALISAMDEAGAKMATGELFIPEVLVAADAMKAAMDVITPAPRRRGGGRRAGRSSSAPSRATSTTSARAWSPSCSTAPGSPSSTSAST